RATSRSGRRGSRLRAPRRPTSAPTAPGPRRCDRHLRRRARPGPAGHSVRARRRPSLEAPRRASDVGRIGSHLIVIGNLEPADDPPPVDNNGRGNWHVLAPGSAAGMDEPVAARYRQVAIGKKAIARAELHGERLAPLVRVGTNRQNLYALVAQLGENGSKTLELADAEGSPVAAIEDEDDRPLITERGEGDRGAGGVRQSEVPRRVNDFENAARGRRWGENEIEIGAEKDQRHRERERGDVRPAGRPPHRGGGDGRAQREAREVERWMVADRRHAQERQVRERGAE